MSKASPSLPYGTLDLLVLRTLGTIYRQMDKIIIGAALVGLVLRAA